MYKCIQLLNPLVPISIIPLNIMTQIATIPPVITINRSVVPVDHPQTGALWQPVLSTCRDVGQSHLLIMFFLTPHFLGESYE